MGEQVIKLLQDSLQFATVQSGELIDQFINYMIFINVLSALRSVAIIFIGWILLKTLRAAIAIYKEEKNIRMLTVLDGIRAVLIASILGLSIYTSYKPLSLVAKILIAPKVYLLEEGAEFILKNRKDK